MSHSEGSPRDMRSLLRGAVAGMTLALAACSRPMDEHAAPAVQTPPPMACATATAIAHDASAPSVPRFEVSYGSAMADIARRFETLGRAQLGRRYPLAEYELGEIEETFEDTLPHASPPKEGHPEVLPDLRRSFVTTTLPALRRDLATRDAKTIAAGFSRTASACNACHEASGHGFLQVPTVAGQSIPETSPLER